MFRLGQIIIKRVWLGKNARIKYKTLQFKKRKGWNRPSLHSGLLLCSSSETCNLPLYTNIHCGVEGNRRQGTKRNTNNIPLDENLQGELMVSDDLMLGRKQLKFAK